MNKETIKAFIAWLELASLDEILTRQEEVKSMSTRITTRDGRNDLSLALRLIDEEVLARLELNRSRK